MNARSLESGRRRPNQWPGPAGGSQAESRGDASAVAAAAAAAASAGLLRSERHGDRRRVRVTQAGIVTVTARPGVQRPPRIMIVRSSLQTFSAFGFVANLFRFDSIESV